MMDEKEMMNKIKYLIKKKRPLEDIMLETGLKEYEVFGFVEMLRQKGWQAEYQDGMFIYQREQIIKDKLLFFLIFYDILNVDLIIILVNLDWRNNIWKNS